MKLSGFLTMAAVTALMLSVPVVNAQAQLFNGSKSGGSSGTPVYNGGNSSGGGAQPLFLDNNTSSPSRSRAPSFLSKPKTVNRQSNGFDRTLNRDSANQISELDRRIAESAMQRMAKAEALKAEIAADTARKKAAPPQYDYPDREDRQFGAEMTGQPQDTRPQVYDNYNNTQPAAPSRLFNGGR